MDGDDQSKKQVETTESRKKIRALNKAKPAPDFKKLHKQWQEKFHDGIAKSKKPTTVVSMIPVRQCTTF